MEAIPLAALVESQDEEVLVLELREQCAGARALEDGVADGAGEPLEHRGMQEERQHLLALALERVSEQELGDVGVAERRCRRGRRGEIDARRPALAALDQATRPWRRRSRARQFARRPPLLPRRSGGAPVRAARRASPLARMAPSGKGGSTRPERTICTLGCASSTNSRTDSWTRASVTRS